MKEYERRAEITSRIPSETDLRLLAVDPPDEWLREPDWEGKAMSVSTEEIESFKSTIKAGDQFDVLQLVKYELASSWWSGFVSWPWLQDKVAEHFVRKVERKLGNFEQFQQLLTIRDSGATKGHIMWAIRQQRTKASNRP